jgi:pyruvate formate lyase activating enzyme
MIKDNIKGFVASSLVDWDGKVVSVIFLAGCNFRCGYCSNKDIVLEPDKIKTISWKEIKNYLENNKDFVDGVVITGGEPTLYDDLPELINEIKNLGFLIKIDTNGSNPEMLQELLDRKLLDSIAMDIKAGFQKYKDIVNVDLNLEKIKKSILIVKKFPDYEFRITLFPGINKEDLIEIASFLKENNANKAFFIQQFRNDECLDSAFEDIKPYKKTELESFIEIFNEFGKFGVRNI